MTDETQKLIEEQLKLLDEMSVQVPSALDLVKQRYPKGLHNVSFEEMAFIDKVYKGQFVSPGYLVNRFGVSREAVRLWGVKGKIRYFSLKKSYVNIPLEDVKELEEYFRKQGLHIST